MTDTAMSRKELEAGKRRVRLRENLAGYGMIFPSMFFFFLFLVFPVFKAFQMSAYKYSGFGKMTDFVGLKNYLTVLQDPYFYTAISITLRFVLVDIVFALGIGFLLAYFLFRMGKMGKFFSVVLYIPAIVPMVVDAIIWRQIYHPMGLLNAVLEHITGSFVNTAWLSNMSTALPAVMLPWVKGAVPFVMLVLYATMLRIDPTLFEAAKLDGASESKIARYIIIPDLLPVFVVMAILRIAAAFRGFGSVFLLTQGGPARATELATIYVYRTAVTLTQYGKANAAAVLIFFIAGGIVTLLMKVIQKKLKNY